MAYAQGSPVSLQIMSSSLKLGAKVCHCNKIGKGGTLPLQWLSCSFEDVSSVHRYEFQMQFGSIGWSVGATLGYAQALKGKKRVIASIGDGSFQVTAQVILLHMLSVQDSAEKNEWEIEYFT